MIYFSYPNTKSCRFCRYYDSGENFCAVAPDYIGLAYLCADFKLEIEPEDEDDDEPDTLAKFQRDYLEKLLLTCGEIETGRTIIRNSTKKIDLWFAPKINQSPPDNNLLSRLTKTRALFEPYHRSVTPDEIRYSMRKLLEVHQEFYRAAANKKTKIRDTDLPWLWIFTPSISNRTLKSFSAESKQETGIYVMAPALLTGLVLTLPPLHSRLVKYSQLSFH
jgi:hypothetical protein